MTESRQDQKWWVMAAVAVGVFLSTIDGSIVNLALPVLAREFGATFAAVQWVVLAYSFTIVSLMLIVPVEEPPPVDGRSTLPTK